MTAHFKQRVLYVNANHRADGHELLMPPVVKSIICFASGAISRLGDAAARLTATTIVLKALSALLQNARRPGQ